MTTCDQHAHELMACPGLKLFLIIIFTWITSTFYSPYFTAFCGTRNMCGGKCCP